MFFLSSLKWSKVFLVPFFQISPQLLCYGIWQIYSLSMTKFWKKFQKSTVIEMYSKVSGFFWYLEIKCAAFANFCIPERQSFVKNIFSDFKICSQKEEKLLLCLIWDASFPSKTKCFSNSAGIITQILKSTSTVLISSNFTCYLLIETIIKDGYLGMWEN